MNEIDATNMDAKAYWLQAIYKSKNVPAYGTLEFRQYVAGLTKNVTKRIEELFELRLTTIEQVRLRHICEDICKRCFLINDKTDKTIENLAIEARHRFFLENYDYPIGHPIIPFDEKEIASYEQGKRHMP